MRGPSYHLSPNEVERLLKEERERRRKLRLLQVREQAKINAANIRNDVRKEKERLMNKLASEIKDQWEEEKTEKVRKFEQKYENTLRTIGEGHREAHLHGDGINRAEKLQREKEAERNAQERFKQAMETKKREDSEKQYESTKHILSRKTALAVEKERAAEIASLPPPPPDVSIELEKLKKKAIPMTDMKAFATTRYHIPDYHVVRADTDEQDMYDAKVQGQETDLKLRQDLTEKTRSRHEQIERARIRGNEALQKEILKHDLGDMMKDLSLLQKKDRRRRQVVLSDLPKQVFIPPEQCLEERQERQQEMERKFDELYLQHCIVTDDLQSFDVSEDQVSQELTESSAHDSTPDISIPMSRINPALRDLTNVGRQGQGAEVKKPAETVLQKLLSRIKEQREVSGTQVKFVPAEKTQTVPENLSETVASKVGWEEEGQERTDAESEPARDRQQARVEDKKKAESNPPDAELIAKNNKMIEDLRRRILQIEEEKQKLIQTSIQGSSRETSLHTEESMTLEEVDIDRSHEAESKDDLPAGKLVTGVFKESNVSYRPGFIPPVAKENLYARNGVGTEERKLPVGINQSKAFGLGVTLPSQVDEQRLAVDRNRKQDAMPGTNRQVTFGANSQVTFDAGSHLTLSAYRPVVTFGTNRQMTFGTSTLSEGTVGTHTLTDVTLGTQRQQDVAQGTYRQQEISGIDRQQEVALGINRQQEMALGINRPQEMVLGINRQQEMALGINRQQEMVLGINRQQEMILGTNRQQDVTLGTSRQQEVSLPPSSLASVWRGQQEELDYRVREYQMKAVQRQSMLDDSTLRKVKEYQSKLLQSHEERKKVLEDVRADIDRRRQDLGLTSQSGSGHSGQAGAGVSRPSIVKDSGDEVHKLTENTKWEPIRPFIADPVKLGGDYSTVLNNAGMSNYQEIPKYFQKPDQEVLQDKVSPKENAEVDSRKKMEKIRKSLSFQDGNDSLNISQISWKDSLEATPASQDSRIISSEEDRGSPVLSHSGLDSFSANLVTQAEHSKTGFQERHTQLQTQLLEIQNHKDAMMKKFNEGQRLLEQQKISLRSKLVAANAQPGSNIPGRSMPLYETGTWDKLGLTEKTREVTQILSGNNFVTSPRMNDSRDSESISGRRSLGTPGNLSNDSYLADISFHKIKSADYRNLPISAFKPFQPTLADTGDQSSQTWAAVLSAAPKPQPAASQPWGSLLSSAPNTTSSQTWASQLTSAPYLDPTKPKPDLPWSQATLPEMFGFKTIEDVTATPSYNPTPSYIDNTTASPASPYTGHQAHELSTIIEVDTPMSAQPPHRVAAPTSSSTQPTKTTYDINPDLYTFQKPDLILPDPTSRTRFGLKSLENLANPESSEGKLKFLSAKRTLDFNSRAAASPVDDQADEDLFSIEMPPLVDLTPLKKDNQGQQDASEGSAVTFSSFDLTGFSEYMRQQNADYEAELSQQNTDHEVESSQHGSHEAESRQQNADHEADLSQDESEEAVSSQHESHDADLSQHRSHDADLSQHGSHDAESRQHGSHEAESRQHGTHDADLSQHGSHDADLSQHVSHDAESGQPSVNQGADIISKVVQKAKIYNADLILFDLQQRSQAVFGDLSKEGEATSREGEVTNREGEGSYLSSMTASDLVEVSLSDYTVDTEHSKGDNSTNHD